MALLGRRQTLPILRSAPPGYYLDGGASGELLLPGRYVPEGAIPGGSIEVFVHRDSEDRIVATTETPFAMRGECAFLQVASTKPGVGAFLRWGLEKDLLLPMREQNRSLRRHDWVVVLVALDERSDRLIATARVDRWLDQTPAPFVEGQAVQLLIESETPLGYRAIINHTHLGLLYRGELAAPLTVGQTMPGVVRTVRDDGKVDLGLDPAGYRRVAPLTGQILEQLRAAGGFLPFHDGSAPDEIRATFGASKKAFKQALGALYRERKIEIEADGIRRRP